MCGSAKRDSTANKNKWFPQSFYLSVRESYRKNRNFQRKLLCLKSKHHVIFNLRNSHKFHYNKFPQHCFFNRPRLSFSGNLCHKNITWSCRCRNAPSTLTWSKSQITMKFGIRTNNSIFRFPEFPSVVVQQKSMEIIQDSVQNKKPLQITLQT